MKGSLNSMRLSISQLTLYRDCPFAWKCRYIDNIETPKSEALQFGTDFHSAISGTSEDELINKMVSVVKKSTPFLKSNSLFTYEKKDYVNLDGFNFTYILDAVNEIDILEFKSAGKPWEKNKFITEWQPHLYLKAEEEKTGKLKNFYYIVVTKENNPKCQVQKVEFNKDIYKQIINTADKLKNDFEFKPIESKNCYFCDYKNHCPKQF